MEPKLQTRRQFCSQMCQATTAAALGSALAGCGGSPTDASSVPPLPILNAATASGAVTLAVDGASPLAAVGGAALVQSAAGNFLVARTSQDGFTALTATCTHQACTITGVSGTSYVCPCHHSRFDQSGRVQNGPAVVSLRSFATSFQDGVLTIRA